MSGGIQAVIFDLDGVLVESEQVWDAARRRLTEDSGGRWSESATQVMMGMSSIEWSRYMHEELGVKIPPEKISAAVVERMEELYHEHLPLIPGARAAVERVAARWPLVLSRILLAMLSVVGLCHPPGHHLLTFPM
jgi:beta-phosphoglucomutase-like phosphatase (HAD superfamily)